MSDLLFPAPSTVDPARYRPDLPEDEREALYGLPRQVRYCKTCVIASVACVDRNALTRAARMKTYDAAR